MAISQGLTALVLLALVGAEEEFADTKMKFSLGNGVRSYGKNSLLWCS